MPKWNVVIKMPGYESETQVDQPDLEKAVADALDKLGYQDCDEGQFVIEIEAI